MQRIVLDKRTKTIKVVNRHRTIRLQHSGKVGPIGPEGPIGPTGYSTMSRAVHGTDANYPRPNALYVEWLGNVAPNQATAVDTWIVTP